MTTASARRPGSPVIALAFATLVPAAALAQQGPVSSDPEFVNPRFNHNTVPGVAAPDVDSRNTVRWGLFLQYERNPVTGYRLDEEVAKVVENRIGAHLGVSWDFTEWGSLRVVVPAAGNWGTEVPEFEANGFGLGDISLGAQFVPFDSRYFNVGLQADVWFPSGRSQAYIGEPSIRGGGGLQLQGKYQFGDWVALDLVGAANVIGRAVLVSDNDFDDGPELILQESFRIRLAWLPVELSFTQALVARSRFTNFFQGGGENGLEVYGGLQLPIRNIGFNTDMVIDVMAGRGTNQGFGTTDLRVLGGLTFTRHPGRKPRPETVDVQRPPPYIPPPPEPEPEEEVAVRLADRIAINKPVEFFVNTSDIKPESLSILQAVADIINEDARIQHLVVEGHASSEGDHTYNYELSRERAESVFRQLVLNGVAPARLSTRAFGEVKPIVEGEGEEAWQYNRRVEFIIVSQLGPDTLEYPDYGTETPLPWTNETTRIVTPKSPDEIELEKLREQYDDLEEQRRRDNFEQPVDESFEFEGGAAPADDTAAPADDAEAPADGTEAPPDGAEAPADDTAPAPEGADAEAPDDAEPAAEEEEDKFSGESFDDAPTEDFDFEETP